jgi:hypothetical protein
MKPVEVDVGLGTPFGQIHVLIKRDDRLLDVKQDLVCVVCSEGG